MAFSDDLAYALKKVLTESGQNAADIASGAAKSFLNTPRGVQDLVFPPGGAMTPENMPRIPAFGDYVPTGDWKNSETEGMRNIIGPMASALVPGALSGAARGAAAMTEGLGAAGTPAAQIGAIMAPASKVAPEKLAALKQFIQSGMTREEAYKAAQLLPMVRKNEAMVGHNFAVDPSDALAAIPGTERFAKGVAGEIMSHPGEAGTASLSDFFNSPALQEHYPEIASHEVLYKYDPYAEAKYSGVYYPGDPALGAESRMITGPKGLEGVISHEGTHAVQHAENLPIGGSPEGQAGAFRRLYEAQQTAGVNPQPLMDWRNRMIDALIERGRSDPDYLLYRGLAGEQAANAGQAMSGIGAPSTPGFTTPLAKQLLSPQELASGAYLNRLLALKLMQQGGGYGGGEFELPSSMWLK